MFRGSLIPAAPDADAAVVIAKADHRYRVEGRDRRCVLKAKLGLDIGSVRGIGIRIVKLVVIGEARLVDCIGSKRMLPVQAEELTIREGRTPAKGKNAGIGFVVATDVAREVDRI